MNVIAVGSAALIAIGIVTAPALAQKSKDTLRFPAPGAESTLDPYLAPGTVANTWGPSVYDNLLGFDVKSMAFVPHIVKAWTHPNPTTYEFELRDDVKWHDGQSLTADDVVYTLNYLVDPKSNLRYKSNWAWLKNTEKLGQNKIRMNLNYAAPDALMWLTAGTPIFPKHLHEALANKADFGTKPVGTGPYHITRMDKNTGIQAEKHPAYVASSVKPPASIGRVIAEPITEPGTLVASLLAGNVDVAFDIPPDQAAALRDSGRFEVTLSPPSIAYSFFGFPTAAWENNKALADVRVRKAIVMAVDRKALVDIQFGAIQKGIQPIDALCSKEQLGCGYTKFAPEFDPAAAKKLLAEAGYPDGLDVSISTTPSYIVEATALAGMLRAVGVRAAIRQHLTATRVQLINEGKTEIGYYGWSGGGMFDVSPQFGRHFLSKEYDDPVLTKMANDASAIPDDAERRKAAAAVFDYATDHFYAFPMIPVRGLFTHTKEVKLNAVDIRAERVNPHEFGWK